MTNNSLVPIRRPDKNGRMVTRWVRSWEVESSALNVPAPVILSPSGRDTEKMRSELSDALGGSAYEDAVGNITNNLDNLTGKTLEVLIDSYRADERGKDALGLWVSKYGNRNNGEFGEQMIREMTTYRPAFSSDADPNFIEHAVSALGEYKQLPRTGDYSSVEPELQEFIHGLMSITEHLHSEWFDQDEDSVPHIIQNKELVALIFEHPEQVEMVRAAMIERKTEDADIIREVLNSESTSLSQGAL